MMVLAYAVKSSAGYTPRWKLRSSQYDTAWIAFKVALTVLC
jgi:hypothetical protein